jgi:hypothetical protein
MSLLHIDPATAERYLKEAQARRDTEKAQEEAFAEQMASDPAVRAVREQLAEAKAAKDADAKAVNDAAVAATVAAARSKIVAELTRLGAAEGDLERLTDEALNQWRLEQAVMAANAPSQREQESQEIEEFLHARSGKAFAEGERFQTIAVQNGGRS